MGVRMVCHCLWAGALLQWVMAAPGLAQDDDPFGAGEGTPVATETPTEDPLAAPFVCVCVDTPEVRADPWNTLRPFLAPEAGEPRLVTRKTAGGVRYACHPRGPVSPPDPLTAGAEQRRRTEPALAVVEQFPEHVLSPLRAGAWVDVTTWREQLLRMAEAVGAEAASVVPDLRHAEHILARLDLFPEIVTMQAPEDGAAYASSVLYGAYPPPGSVQLGPDGRLVWPSEPPPVEAASLNNWKRLPRNRLEGLPVGNAWISGLQEALAASGATVRLDDLHGRSVAEVTQAACETSGASLRVTDRLGGYVVVARGGAVAWSDALEALLMSCRAAPASTAGADSDLWDAPGESPSAVLSRALGRQAPYAAIDELSRRADVVVGEALASRPGLAETLPLRAELFLSRWTGRYSELTEADRPALDAVTRERPVRVISAGAPDPMVQDGERIPWHAVGDDPIVRFRMTYELLLLPCLEYGARDQATGEWVVRSVPEDLYERGASRDMPVYACRPTGFLFY